MHRPESVLQLIDIHSHVLPGLDDGPRTLKESLSMCKLYVADGVTTVVATPHMGDSRFDVKPQSVRSAACQLSEACRQHGLDLEILPGGDVRLEPELLDAIDAGRALTLADTGKYLLLELPLQTAPSLGDLIPELSLRGIIPILSHPERNMELWRKPHRLAEMVEAGCLVQITAGSLFGNFTAAAKRTAERFLKMNLVHAVASDAHSALGRRPQLRRTAAVLDSMAGEGAAARLLRENPFRIINGKSLELPNTVASTMQTRNG